MNDNGQIPPIMPDDFAALAAIAGPLYQESRLIESFTSDNPIPGTHKEYGSMNIKQQLEQAHRLAQASVVRPPQPMFVPPSVEPLPQPNYVNGTASYTPYQSQPIELPKSNEQQLELVFDKGKQDETNDLLREISKKLTKLINIIEKSEDSDIKVPKLKNVKS